MKIYQLKILQKKYQKTNCKIIFKKSNDPRSYRLDSSKLLSSGFVQKYSVSDTINQLIEFFKKNNLKKDQCENINWMKKKGLDGKVS